MQIIAHRGDAVHHVENTIPAFEAAVDAGADGIEFDVRLTADGYAVVMHDDDVERTTGGRGRISAMTLDEVRALSAGSAGVPLLDEVVEAVGGRIHLIVELKAVPVGETFSAVPVLEAVSDTLARADDITIDSFDPNALDAAGDLLPGVPRALACVRIGDDWMLPFAQEHGYDVLMVAWPDADAAWVAEAAERGLRTLAWSAGPGDVAAARAMGLSGVLVFDPAAAIAASGEHG